VSRLNRERAAKRSKLLAARARVPGHVVYRPFATETVVLNLETGTYHGLNSTGGRMLEVLEREERVRDAIASLADEYGTEQSRVEEDVCDFCNDLVERGLIEIHLNGHH
jgi:hypothetical protein